MDRKFSLGRLQTTGEAIKRRNHLICSDITGRAHSVTDDRKTNPFHHLFSPGIVRVRHGESPLLLTLHQGFRKKLPLALKIMREGLMIIEMVRRKIREDDMVELAPKNPIEIESVGGNLHDDMRHPLIYHLPQDSLKI